MDQVVTSVIEPYAVHRNCHHSRHSACAMDRHKKRDAVSAAPVVFCVSTWPICAQCHTRRVDDKLHLELGECQVGTTRAEYVLVCKSYAIASTRAFACTLQFGSVLVAGYGMRIGRETWSIFHTHFVNIPKVPYIQIAFRFLHGHYTKGIMHILQNLVALCQYCVAFSN